MTPKEKQKNYLKVLSTNFDIDLGINTAKDEKIYDSAKQCALIAAKEVLNEIPYINNTDYEITKRFLDLQLKK
jgi:hypothetical protein